ncbi:MAG: hypothetical protein GIX03_01340 [Candidatus Eremiobacteraeota bacterium]|nr:hypothetical protein [Candidatus Eremiobacteraeota bacterium]MBC5801663.1 hypothetical protein [Candidatus Eremiobacteraeota bacterium]MBC5824055.1 hypothetical protein [Candidatus Eremiobacteraeota bacterium]
MRTAVGFDLHNIFEMTNRRVELDEHYRFNPNAQTWSVTLANGAYVATAAPWTGNIWTFNGTTQADGNGRVTVRMVYQYFDDFVFRRDFQVLRGDAWMTYAAETCTRS